MNVLIVEDEIIARNALATLLERVGYITQAVASAEMALKRFEEGHRPEIALVDLDLPGMNGVDLIDRLTAEQPQVFPVLITAANPERLVSLKNAGILHLRKPLDFNELLEVLEKHSRSH